MAPIVRPPRVRAALSWALVVVASMSIVLALIVGYVRRAAVDSDQFANRATAALQSDSVRSLAAQRITDQIILEHKSDLLAARPIIESVVSSVVGGRAFTGVFRAGVRDMHRALFDRDQNTLTLTVADVGTIVAAGLEVVAPGTAKQVRATAEVHLVTGDIGDASATAVRAARTITVLALLLLVLAGASAAGAVLLAADRRRAFVRLGVGAAIAGMVLVVALGIVRSAVVDHAQGPEERDAVRAVWDAFLQDLHTAAWILAGAGAVLAAAAASLIRPIDIDAPLRRAADWVRAEPASPPIRALRATALIAVGVLFIVDRDAVLRLLFTAVGLYLIYAGVSALLWLVYQPRAAAAAVVAQWADGATWIAGVFAALVIAAGAGAFVGTGGTTHRPARSGRVQRQHRALRAARWTRSRSPPPTTPCRCRCRGWYSSEQDRPIADQLRDGIRGLLIDTHYADRLPNGRLRTYFGSPEELRRSAKHDGVSQDAVDAALRIRDRLGFAGEGERGMYLCHSFCELGGTPLRPVLDDMHDFLVANPGEVVVVINQDYVTPEDFVGAVQDAGLERARLPRADDRPWPTLREMIDSEPARGLPGREPGGRGALVPPGLRGDHGGDAVHVHQGRAADGPGQARRRAASRTAGRTARRSSSSTTGSRPTRPAALARRDGQRVRAAAAPRCASASASATTSRTSWRSTSTAAAICSRASTRSTASGRPVSKVSLACQTRHRAPPPTSGCARRSCGSSWSRGRPCPRRSWWSASGSQRRRCARRSRACELRDCCWRSRGAATSWRR